MSLTCMRCGHQSGDVAVGLVDLEREAAEEGERIRVVEVELVTELRHVRDVRRVTVPERYATEYRCRDRAGCGERYRAQAEPMPAAAPTGTDDREETPWL